MIKEKVVEKIKTFRHNTDAISPIIATILVLAVAVAAGVGLYFWFDTFQEDAQKQVGTVSDSNLFTIANKAGDAMVVTMETTQNVPYASAYHDYKKEPYDHYITFPGYKGSDTYAGVASSDATKYNTGTDRDEGLDLTKYQVVPIDTYMWEDERFVLEIPVQLKANANLHNVKIKVDLDNREIIESGSSWGKLGFCPNCIHLDRSNGYALQYYDSASCSWKVFKGELHPNSEAITFDDQKYIYSFDGDKPTLELSDFMSYNDSVSELLGTAETDDGIYNETNLNDAVTYPDRQSDLGRYYYGDGGVYMQTGKIITAEGKKKSARKVSAVDGVETPWLTASTFLNSWGASNSDAQDAYLISNTYPIGDLKAGEVKTAYVYVYVNWAQFNADTGRVVATVPFEFSSADGFSSTEIVTFNLYESSVS